MSYQADDGIEILIAEDSPTQREQLRYLLEAQGYKVIAAPDGRRALELLHQHRPTLVISDVVMPELDGYGLCKAIKSDADLKDIPVILVTTLADPRDVLRGLECGADNYIRKPYEEKYLLARIDYLLMNVELRQNQRMQMALEIQLGGSRHRISAERQQILDLLVSTFEEAVRCNDELKQRERALAHSNQLFQCLSHISEGLNHASTEQQVAEMALERAFELPGIQAGWIFLRNEGADDFRLVASRGSLTTLTPDMFAEACACQRLMLSGQLGATARTLDCERLFRVTLGAKGSTMHATVPLWLVKDHPMGMMNLVGGDQGAFDDATLGVLQSVGNQVAVALERTRLHEHLEHLVALRTAKLAEEVEQRKRIEAEQARLVSIIEATPDLVGNADTNGRPIFLNPAGRRMLGLDPAGDDLPTHIADAHPVWVNRILQEQAFPHALEHGSWHGEIALLRTDGTELPVSAVIIAHRTDEGVFDGLSTITRDISQRVETESAMRQALATLDAIDDAAFVFTPNDLRFIYVNDGAARQVGYSPDELLRMTPLDIHPEAEEAHLRAMLAPMMAGKAASARHISKHRHRDGHDIEVEENVQLISSDGGQPRFIVIARDVSERQATLHQLEATTKELAASNAALEAERGSLAARVTERTSELTIANTELARAKLEAEEASRAKSAFLATMSHEIRTPMNGVLGMLEVLEHSRLTEHQRDQVLTMRDSATTLLALIDDILDFSKIEAGRIELEQAPLSIADLVEGLCTSQLSVARRRGVRLRLFVDPGLPERVLGDDTRLRQILYNLVGNAIKFSAGNPARVGRVAVQATLVVREPLRIAFTIEDNGIGMDETARARLFSPFTQAEASTTRRFGGTGLGLSIARRLVALMGGEIDVESTPGMGSKFVVTLPFAPALEQPVREQPDLSGLACCLIDDPDLDTAALASYLEHAGATVRCCGSAEEVEEVAMAANAPVILIHPEAESPRWWDGDLSENLRRVRIGQGRRQRARTDGPDCVSIDGDALRRQAFLRTVAVAAGRASQDIFDDRSTDALQGESMPPLTVAQARAENRLILVAEDDSVNQKVILQQLALLGYAAEVAGDGAEALGRWRDGGFALLFTDLHMPAMDGYQLTAEIRRQESGRRRMPIIALTANALRSEAARAKAAGMDEYLTKPVALARLRKTLENWLPSTGTPPPSTPSRPLDVAVLQRLVGDDPVILNDFLSDYARVAAQALAELRTAAAATDHAQVAATAHKLKSSSRSVGALPLGDLCAELENAGKRNDWPAIESCMGQLEKLFAEVDMELTKLLAQEKP